MGYIGKMCIRDRAYVELPTAVGTLIIAVAVQTTMLGCGFFMGERPSRQQGIGIGVALVGLVLSLIHI